MIKVPGQVPPIPPHVPPKEVKPKEEATRPAAPKEGVRIGQGPEYDAHAIAVRLAALATEAKEKEIAAEEFSRILEEVIKLTKLANPQAAMEEANRKLQKEIEETIEQILANKDLMEEAEDWQNFAELLSRMDEEQVQGLLGLLQETIKGFA